jgi:hypothetical protein
VARPENIRIQRSDGTVIPCELADLGVDEEGIHMWDVLTPVDIGAGDRVLVGKWPASTGLSLGNKGEIPDGMWVPPFEEDGVC